MAIPIKTNSDIALMAQGGAKLAKIRDHLASLIKVGLKVEELEKIARQEIKKAGGKPNFCLVGNYPYSICVSFNNEIVHGMPVNKTIARGDIVSLDIGMLYKGWHLDTATTVGIENISVENKKLIDVTKTALNKALALLKPGIKLGLIQNAIQEYVEQNGFCLIRNYTGHGIGRALHEDPKIPNFGNPDAGPELKEGMVLAIEPMVSSGDCNVEVAADGWTAKMENGANGAHFEHTIAITKTGCHVLTS